jgi:Dual specificity phosphatase, catalytic domain
VHTIEPTANTAVCIPVTVFRCAFNKQSTLYMSMFDRDKHFAQCLTQETPFICTVYTTGMSRSATLVIGYLMSYRSMTLINALQFTKARRPLVSPNSGTTTTTLLPLLNIVYGRTSDACVYTKHYCLKDTQCYPVEHNAATDNLFLTTPSLHCGLTQASCSSF